MAVNSVTPAQQDAIAGLYAAFWNRAPDTTGFGYWVGVLASGEATIDEIATTMRNLPEGVEEYPLWSTNEQLVTEVYNNVFGRAPDPEGLVFWTTALNQGRATFPELVIDMVEAAQGNADGALFDNKVEVGVYVATVAQTDNAYVCDNAFNLVTADPASVDTAEAWVDTNNTGATYTLTTNIDTVDVVGHKTDTVVGVQQAANQTWNTGDTINGNGLTKINLVANGDAGGVSIVDANNIASVNVNLAQDTEIDETEFNDVAKIAITNGTAGGELALTAHQLATTIAVEKNRTYDVLVNDYADASGKADTVALSVTNAGTSTTIFADGDVLFDVGTVANVVEAVTLATTGTNFVTIDAGTGASKLTVTGNGTNEIVIASGGLASTNAIDLSGTTGTNVLDIGTLISSAETVTGGSGDDTLVADLNATGQHLPTIAGVENLEFTFTKAGTINASKITGATSLDVSDSAEVATLTNLSADVATLSTIVTNDKAVSFGYASKAAAVVDYNVGGKAAVSNNSTTFSNVAELAINAAGTSTSSLGALAAGTAATSLTLTTAAAANDLTAGALTGANLAAIGVAATAGDVTLSTNDNVTATALEEVVIEATGGADVDVAGGQTIIANDANVSSFSTISVVAGDDSAINIGEINGGTGTKAAAITTYDVELGANGSGAIGAVTAYTVGDVNVTVGAASAASTFTLGVIKADDIGNITVSTGLNETVTISTDAAREVGTTDVTVGNITATGAGAFTYDFLSTATDGSVGTVDASGLTGVADIDLSGANNGAILSGGTKGDTLGGTTGDDIITGNAGADAMTGNGGADVFNYTAWSQTGITVATADSIADFDTINDLIDVTTAAGTNVNYGSDHADYNNDFTLVKAAADAVLTTTVTYAYVYDTDVGNETGYLFYGASGTATNVIILTGLGAGDFDFSNIV